MRIKTVVVIPDMQIPYHDLTAINNLIEFVSDFDPDHLVNVGDDVDSPETARWNKGYATEYAGTLQEGFDQARMIHAAFRDAIGDKPYFVSRSNHGDRTAAYIKRYAPALSGLRSLDLAALVGYKELGIHYKTEPFLVAPDWVCAHGDEGSLSPIAGRTAGLLAAKWGVSVVCGHSHRAGIQPTSYGFGGVVHRTVYGMEVGHMMSMKAAHYLKGGHGNWQQAFGILYVHGVRVTPVLIPIHSDGSFVVEGVQYGL